MTQPTDAQHNRRSVILDTSEGAELTVTEDNHRRRLSRRRGCHPGSRPMCVNRPSPPPTYASFTLPAKRLEPIAASAR